MRRYTFTNAYLRTLLITHEYTLYTPTQTYSRLPCKKYKNKNITNSRTASLLLKEVCFQAKFLANFLHSYTYQRKHIDFLKQY